MTPPTPHQPGIVAQSTGPALADQLQETWAALLDLCGPLTAAQWALPTDCPGWTVADQVAHIAGTEAMLAGRAAPPAPPGEPPPHVHNEIGRTNEAWLVHYRALGTGRLVADLRALVSERLDRLRSMTEAELDAPSWTPVGQATFRRFMQIRVFDCWTHEQDVRLAIDRPGHLTGAAAEQALDQVVQALGYIVGKLASAPAGSSVRFELPGPVTRTVLVAVGDRAEVVDHFDGPPATTIRMPSDILMRLASGRSTATAHATQVTIDGDVALGQQIVDHLAFTI